MEYGIEMVSRGTIHILSFMSTVAGIQAVLRFSLGNLRGCNVGITGGRYL
jgi:hypothetical protein